VGQVKVFSLWAHELVRTIETVTVTLDIHLDFRSEVPPGIDPDKRSPTLREYHRMLWSKQLPTGHQFELTKDKTGHYLYHSSELGEFSLASDTIGRSYVGVKKMSDTLSKVPNSLKEEALSTIYTIGSFTLFPGNRIDGKMTINGARGFYSRVFDRFDITLECIRRLYEKTESPLTEVFERYRSFFSLFGSFEGYVDFFLFQDLVNENGEIRFFLPFDPSFPTNPFPKSVDEYYLFVENELEFIRARRERMRLSLG
jgi:hypothetical protein